MAMRSDGEDENVVQSEKTSESEVTEYQNPMEASDSDGGTTEGPNMTRDEYERQKQAEEKPKKTKSKQKSKEASELSTLPGSALMFVCSRKLEITDAAEFGLMFPELQNIGRFKAAYRFLYAKVVEATDEQALSDQVEKVSDDRTAKLFVDRLARISMDPADWQDYVSLFEEVDG